MRGQAVPTPGSAPSSHRMPAALRDVGTSMCREPATFSFASFRGWEEEGRGKRTTRSVEEKIKKVEDAERLAETQGARAQRP